MFEIGEFIVKPNKGICKVEEIGPIDMSGGNRNKLYYILSPLSDKGAKIYVPVDKENTGMRSVMNEEQAWKIINGVTEVEEVWIENDKYREQRYKEAIKSCDPVELISIIKNMYRRKKERNSQGKKNTIIDERYFRQAEDILYGELAFAIGKDKSEMRQVIIDTITNK